MELLFDEFELLCCGLANVALVRAAYREDDESDSERGDDVELPLVVEIGLQTDEEPDDDEQNESLKLMTPLLLLLLLLLVE